MASFTMFMVAIALGFSTTWLAALVVAGILLCVAGGLGYAGFKMLPTKPMAQTKERIESDVKQLKERLA
jgi:putative superfamily III holin-X